MAEKYTRRPSPAFTQLAKLAESVLKDKDKPSAAEVKEVETQFLKDPYTYFFTGFPCPQFSHLDPTTVSPGQPVDFYYYPGDFETAHTLVVIDITGTTSVERWRLTEVPTTSPWPFKVTIPAQTTIGGATVNTFEAGHDYMFALYPSLLGIPVGCVTWVLVTVTTSSLYKKLFFSAVQVDPPVAMPPLKVLKPVGVI